MISLDSSIDLYLTFEMRFIALFVHNLTLDSDWCIQCYISRHNLNIDSSKFVKEHNLTNDSSTISF